MKIFGRFLEFGSLIFLDIAYNGNWTWYLVNDLLSYLLHKPMLVTLKPC